MLNKLPQEIYILYKKIGIKVLLYTVIKWALTPFEIMEHYVPKEGRIFDLGCGNGLFSNFICMKSTKRHVVGIDVSFKRVKIAKLAIRGRENVKFYVGDVNNIRLIPCECIVFSDFLHHLRFQSQESLIRYAANSLKKNGILIIKEIDKHPKWKFIISFILDSVLNLKGKLYHRNSSEFKMLLSKYGFIVKIISIHKFLPLSNIIYIGRRR